MTNEELQTFRDSIERRSMALRTLADKIDGLDARQLPVDEIQALLKSISGVVRTTGFELGGQAEKMTHLAAILADQEERIRALAADVERFRIPMPGPAMLPADIPPADRP
jgi:hypothetical protein